MIVSELKKALEEYPDDALVYMEPWNAYNKGKDDTGFSQKAESTYQCIGHMTAKKALMIVGSAL